MDTPVSYQSEHTTFSALLLGQCHYEAKFIRNGDTPWRIVDGIAIAPTYRVECPKTTGATISWTIPVARANEQALSLDEIAGYKIILNGCEYQITTCDTNGLCGGYSEPVISEGCK